MQIEELFEQRKKIIKHLKNRLNISDVDAEDAVMEAITKLLSHEQRVKHAYAWTTRVAFRTAVRSKKRKEREQNYDQTPSDVSQKHFIRIRTNDPIVNEIIYMRLHGVSWSKIAKHFRVSKDTAKLKCKNFLEEI